MADYIDRGGQTGNGRGGNSVSKFVNVAPILQDQYLGYTRVSDTAWQKGYWEGVDTVCDRLREAPTIDAVPVVRCKDCIHLEKGCRCRNPVGAGIYENDYILVDSDDFCSYGERKEGADNG